MSHKALNRRERIKKRIRKIVKGTKERPRLTVFRSNMHIYAQLVDDETGHTLVSASSLSEKKKLTKSEQARAIGVVIANKAIKAGITKAVFDRNGYLYHGRVKALAESARETGLKI